MVADAESARCAQALAEGPDDEVYTLFNTGLLGASPTSLAKDTQGMRLIDE